MQVQFQGENGAGDGLRREWFAATVAEILDIDRGALPPRPRRTHARALSTIGVTHNELETHWHGQMALDQSPLPSRVRAQRAPWKTRVSARLAWRRAVPEQGRQPHAAAQPALGHRGPSSRTPFRVLVCASFRS